MSNPLDRPVRVRDTYGRRVEVITKDVVAAHNAQTEDPANHLARVGDVAVDIARLTQERDEALVEAKHWRTAALIASESVDRVSEDRELALAEVERLRGALREVLLAPPGQIREQWRSVIREALGEHP